MNRPNLLFDIDVLHMTELCLCFALWVPIEALDGCLFPPYKLVFCDGLSGNGIKYVTSLAG